MEIAVAPQRFIIREIESGRGVAVVEALDSVQARERFDRLIPIVQRSLRRNVDTLVAVEPQDPGETVHWPFFTEHFFEIIESSDALKH